jgi:hypothetical protein
LQRPTSLRDDATQAARILVATPIVVPGALIGVGLLADFLPLLALGVGWVLLKAITGNLYGTAAADRLAETTPRQWILAVVAVLVALVAVSLLTSQCTPDRPCQL